jgi:hypothetical protein
MKNNNIKLPIKRIFELSEKLFGKQSDHWLESHNDHLDAIPTNLMLTPDGRIKLYEHLVELQ